MSLAQTGVHVLKGDLIEAAGSGLEIVKSAYDAYHENETDQASFETLLRQPLLLSSEQDQLIQGLRAQHFFDDFQYDAQRGEWIATPNAGTRAASPARAMSSAFDVGSSLSQAASAAADGGVFGTCLSSFWSCFQAASQSPPDSQVQERGSPPLGTRIP